MRARQGPLFSEGDYDSWYHLEQVYPSVQEEHLIMWLVIMKFHLDEES